MWQTPALNSLAPFEWNGYGDFTDNINGLNYIGVGRLVGDSVNRLATKN